jgi:hypothetical protein
VSAAARCGLGIWKRILRRSCPQRKHAIIICAVMASMILEMAINSAAAISFNRMHWSEFETKLSSMSFCSVKNIIILKPSIKIELGVCAHQYGDEMCVNFYWGASEIASRTYNRSPWNDQSILSASGKEIMGIRQIVRGYGNASPLGTMLCPCGSFVDPHYANKISLRDFTCINCGFDEFGVFGQDECSLNVDQCVLGNLSGVFGGGGGFPSLPSSPSSESSGSSAGESRPKANPILVFSGLCRASLLTRVSIFSGWWIFALILINAGFGRVVAGNDCGPFGLPGNWPIPRLLGLGLSIFGVTFAVAGALLARVLSHCA